MNDNVRDIKMFLGILFGFVLMLTLFMMNNSEQAKDTEHELKINGSETVAVTYNYASVLRKNYSSKNIEYVYFVENQRFIFNRTLGDTRGAFERFEKPQLCKVIYLKNQPRIHKIFLDYYPDTINNAPLKSYISENFEVKRINGVDSIQNK